MSKVKGSVNQLESDPIVSQILADCAQVPQQLDPSIGLHQSQALLERRNWCRRRCQRIVQNQLRIGGTAKPAHRWMDETQDQLVPVVEALSDKAWKDDILDEQVASEMMDRAIMKLAGRDSAKEAWKDFVLPDDIVGIKINPLAGKQFSTRRIIVDKIIEGLYGAGVLKNQIIIWDRFEAHLTNAGYEINQTNQEVRVFASDSPGVGYDDELFYESKKDSKIRRENGSMKIPVFQDCDA